MSGLALHLHKKAHQLKIAFMRRKRNLKNWVGFRSSPPCDKVTANMFHPPWPCQGLHFIKKKLDIGFHGQNSLVLSSVNHVRASIYVTELQADARWWLLFIVIIIYFFE